MTTIDYTTDRDMDRVADIAYQISERLRVEPTRLFGELSALAERHPAKLAQIVMTLAAWFDPDTPCSVLWNRVEAIAAGVPA